MKIFDRMNNYLLDREFKVEVFSNNVHIINFEELLDFNNKEVKVKYNKKIVVVKGKDLVVTKMVEDEILITGLIEIIKFN